MRPIIVFVTACFLSCVFCGLANSEDVETADRLFKAGKWQQAKDAYEAVLPELSGNELARALRQVGYTRQVQGQHEKALPYFHRALKLEGIDAEHVSGAWLRIGYSLRLLKRGEEGIAALDKAATVEGAPANHVAEALLYAAWEHNTRQEREQALAKFRRIESIEGVHANYIATALLSSGRILQQQGQFKEAIAAYEKLSSLTPVAAVNRARARVYILECEALLAGDIPFHIKPYVSKVTTTSAKVFWVSQGEVPTGKVILKSEKSNSIPREFAPATSGLKDTICHLHAATLDNLEPNTSYTYEVGCGDEQIRGSFKTAPESGTSFTFCLIGDTQSYHEGLQPLLDAMAEEKSDFTLHVGDITDRGNLWGEWKASFFDPGNGYLRDRVFWPVYGNHDGGPYFPALFELQKQYWYSFDWGDAHFIVLDSYGAGSGGRGRQEQLAWLAEDLAANRKPWTFVALHVPMVATRNSLKWFGENDFLPLLEKHAVDVVFSGHHPHYRRYEPIGTRPIVHITSGGGGGPVGGYMPSPLLAQGINVNHYCKVHIERSKLTLTAHAISGAVIDRFELTKDSPLAERAVDARKAKALIGLYQELLTDRTHELHLLTDAKPKPSSPVELLLDLSKLPRGPLDPQQFGDDATLIVESTKNSLWDIPRQSFRLADKVGRFRATAPNSVALGGTSINPAANLKIQLLQGDRGFESFETTARIQVK